MSLSINKSLHAQYQQPLPRKPVRGNENDRKWKTKWLRYTGEVAKIKAANDALKLESTSSKIQGTMYKGSIIENVVQNLNPGLSAISNIPRDAYNFVSENPKNSMLIGGMVLVAAAGIAANYFMSLRDEESMRATCRELLAQNVSSNFCANKYGIS